MVQPRGPQCRRVDPARALTPENTEYIRVLPKARCTVDGFQVVHGSPFDEDEYVLAAGEADQAFSYLERRLAFFGHTHVQGGFIWNHSRVETIQRTPAGCDSAGHGDRSRLRLHDQPRVRPASRATATLGPPTPSTIPRRT